MSESKTEDETLAFKRYDPKYPLPQEILQMSRDETVCQFCGVSYLIHTEIKKLEARIKELESQLKDYELLKVKESQFKQISDEQNLKVQELEEKLSTRIQMISSLNNDLELRDLEINRLKKKSLDFENEKNELLVSNEQLKKKMLVYESVVKTTKLNLLEQKSELKQLELTSKDQLKMMQQYFAFLNTQMHSFLNKLSRESTEKGDEVQVFKSQLSTLQRELSAQKEQALSYEKQLESLQNLKQELGSQITILNDELNKSKSLSQRYSHLENEKIQLVQLNSEFNQQIESLKLELSALNFESNELRNKLSSNQERLSSANRTYEREMKQRNEELSQLRVELELSKKRLDEKDKLEREFFDKHQINSSELTRLNYEIKSLNDKIADLQSEREAMSLAHQCQITQLKDNFKEKLKSNEDWPKRVEEELNKERAKHLNEMETFETRLKENFHIELEIQKQKYNELALKYQSVLNEQENNSRAKLNDAEINKNKLANELRLLHDEKLANEQKLKQDLENLRAITKDLHQRLEKYTNDDTDRENAKQSDEIIKKNAKINELEQRIKTYEIDMENQREEIKVLHETVSKECIERQELLDKLEKTKDELLEMRKNAYSSQQNPFPHKASIAKPNYPLAPLKNGPNSLVDTDKTLPTNNHYHSYPKNLNEFGSRKANGSPNTSFHGSASNRLNSAGASNNQTSGASSRAASEKSTAESSAKVIEPFSRVNKIASIMNAAGNNSTEPIQLFKRINELNQTKPQNDNQTEKTKKTGSVLGNASENKKRISLLLARKS